MTDEQKGYLQALSDMRSRRRWQIGQALSNLCRLFLHNTSMAYVVQAA